MRARCADRVDVVLTFAGVFSEWTDELYCGLRDGATVMER
jgi:hypothetical protein